MICRSTEHWENIIIWGECWICERKLQPAPQVEKAKEEELEK